jgi:hypothetical protein
MQPLSYQSNHPNIDEPASDPMCFEKRKSLHDACNHQNILDASKRSSFLILIHSFLIAVIDRTSIVKLSQKYKLKDKEIILIKQRLTVNRTLPQYLFLSDLQTDMIDSVVQMDWIKQSSGTL